VSDLPTISDVARAYLRLHLIDGIGPITMGKLLAHFGSADAVLAASPDQWRCVRGIGRSIAEGLRQSLQQDRAEQEIALAAQQKVRILCPLDDEYPPLLKHVPDGPVCLYVRGRLQPQDGVSLGVVGSRKPSYYGQEQARFFSEALARSGLTIISGLAYGVDACAHQGAISAGGRTVAVLGNGLSSIYPPGHAQLAEEIAESGAVVSELPMNTAPDAGNFPRRNRIIAGMSLGTLVIEGSLRSGAMITARLAGDYDREVFALPGRIDCPTSAGPNSLIREGAAKLVMNPGDILDGLGDVGRVLRGDSQPSEARTQGLLPFAAVTLTDSEQRILNALDTDPLPIEMIVDAAGLSASQTAAALTTLQLKRLIRQLPGNQFVATRQGRG